MTRRKHLKQLIRARMAKTGERYAAARRHIVAEQSTRTVGIVPASAALRLLLAHAGFCAPHTGEAPTEALAFGIGGGVGAGMFAFHYAKEDFSSFYVAGRHLWQDDVAWFDAACRRFGFTPKIAETGSKKAAEAALKKSLEGGRPVVAWVDKASLPHRGLPDWMQGGTYHVVTVLGMDDAGTVRIADLADEPVEVPREAFAAARARIAKQKNRLLWLEGSPAAFDLRAAVDDALTACHEKLVKQRIRNFTVDTFADWADRLEASKGKESWAVMFPQGHKLFAGLRWGHEYIEHDGTGGGLCRPLFASFLDEAAKALSDEKLARAAEAYRALGEEWSALADALLDETIPLLAETRRVIIERQEVQAAGASPDELREHWARLEALSERARDELRLDEERARALRHGLAERVRAIHAHEREALELLRR